MPLAEWILWKLSRRPDEPEYAGATSRYTVGNALDFPKLTIPGFLEMVRGKTVLDHGCGPGFQAVAMALAGARRVVGVDIWDVWLQKGRDLALHEGCADKVTFTDALPAEEKFDVVVSLGAFEHYADPSATLRQMRELAAPGAKILISFAEPWLSPRGSHMSFFTRVPWVNVLFPERAVLRVRARYRDDGATRYEEVLSGLNRMTVGKFELIIRDSGLRVEHYSLRAVKRLPLVTRFPVLREFLTAACTCILSVPGPSAISARPAPNTAPPAIR